MSREPDAATSEVGEYRNHPATFGVWHWLDSPASSHLTPEQRERCEEAARTLDKSFFELEAGRAIT